MSAKNCLWYKYKVAVILLVLVLIIPVLTACDDDNDDESVITATTSIPTSDANNGAFAVNVPTIEGPITGPGEPYDRAIKSGRTLSEDGYEQHEYFVSGTATSYRAINNLPDNRMWEVKPAESAAYKTRILVYRPIAPASFNGTVVAEWLNVTAGIESAPDYRMLHTELLRRGYAWIGVSAQYVGVEGGGASHGLTLVDMPLKKMNVERYVSLNHPGDSYSYDIFSQVASGIRNHGDVDPLAGYDVERILAVGESQSAFRLVTYVNAIHPHVQLYDGFLLHSRGGNTAPLRDDTGDDIGDFSGGYKLRTDLNTPALILESETDLFELGYYEARQDDTDSIRLWEMAGTAHADIYSSTRGESDDGTDPAFANLIEVINPNPMTKCPLPVNSGPQHFIAKAAIHQLDNWVRTGNPPPTADRLEITGDPPAFVLDEFGNVKGGIRTPYVDVPIAKLTGVGQLRSESQTSSNCFLYGITELFDKENLATLYPDHATYVTAVENSTDEAVAAGYLMPEDGELIKAAAAASDIGNP